MFLQHMARSRRSVALNYFRTGLRILFTTLLETKTQLWELMWAFLGCCIGSSGIPLHPPLPLPKWGQRKHSHKNINILVFQLFSRNSKTLLYAREVMYLINKGVISPYVQEQGGIFLKFNILCLHYVTYYCARIECQSY